MKSRRTFLKSLFAAPAAVAAAPELIASDTMPLAAIEACEAGMKQAAMDPDAVRKLWVAGVAAYEQSEDFFKAFEVPAEGKQPVTIEFGKR